MATLEASIICCLFGAVELLGLTVAWLTRLSQGSRGQTSCQCLFFGSLALVGGATIVAFGLGPSYWLASGATLAFMVLTVTCDFSRCGKAAVW
jgi:hypothetical protein